MPPTIFPIPTVPKLMPPMRPPAIEGKDLTSVAHAIAIIVKPQPTIIKSDNSELPLILDSTFAKKVFVIEVINVIKAANKTNVIR